MLRHELAANRELELFASLTERLQFPTDEILKLFNTQIIQHPCLIIKHPEPGAARRQLDGQKRRRAELAVLRRELADKVRTPSNLSLVVRASVVLRVSWVGWVIVCACVISWVINSHCPLKGMSRSRMAGARACRHGLST